MPNPRTQAKALAVLTWNQESVMLSDFRKIKYWRKQYVIS
jgi:hypothetical protein